MRYRIMEVELSGPVKSINLEDDERGLGIVGRLNGLLVGFYMQKLPRGTRLSQADFEHITDRAFAHAVLESRVKEELTGPPPAPLPSLSIAICTKDRAERLSRLLSSLIAPCESSPFASTEVLVVDNAPSDASTAKAVAKFPKMRLIVEPKGGLNFARNAALLAARGKLLAFLDDDVVIDRDWLEGLAMAFRSRPDAGGFTGLVLPYKLDTEARIAFESRGGFGRGFTRREWHCTSFHYDLHPVGAGLMGAGCNMAFDASLLRSIGGFDEALDTGAPLPGGGDLDIFYRVLRTGRPMVYEPRLAVYHEHRETMPELRRQYWTWGLGMMAFLEKARRSDPEYRERQRAMLRWWFFSQTREIVSALAHLRGEDLRFAIEQFRGGVQGLFGEYNRSRKRIAAIRALHE